MEGLTPNVTNITVNAKKLQESTTGCKINFKWFGVKRSVTAEQTDTAADAFDAESQCLSVSKKILNTRNPSLRALNRLRTEVRNFWKGLTLPWTEETIRLLRQDDVEKFDNTMQEFRQALKMQVAEVDAVFHDLRMEAAKQLGTLYNDSDYPTTLENSFEVSWEFVNVNPPDYLMQLHPKVYAEQLAKVEAKFANAVTMAEDAFLDEFQTLVSHLTERLVGQKDGKPMSFRESSIENLIDFFAKFKHLNMTSSEQLDALVEQAQKAVVGVTASDIRNSNTLRSTVAENLGNISKELDGMMVLKPKRKLSLKKDPKPELEPSGV